MKNRRENQAIPRKKSLFRRICSRGMLLVGMLMCVNFWSYASGQVKTVSLNVRDKALKEVLGMVREQAGVRFIYSEVELRKAKPVSVEFENQPLQEAMEKLLAGQPFASEIEGDIVVIRPVSPAPQTQEIKMRTVKGKVTDENGQPVPGANVYLKGTTIGVATDIDGNYSLTFGDSQAVLMVSFVGYKTVEEAIGTRETVNFQLEPENEALAEVVVTGYQTISKERATGAFEKLGTEKMEMKRLDNLSSVLEGEIAGYSDGIIRGVSTMNAQQSPLYVIDGFPVENTSIDAYGSVTENLPVLNMEDIESITVLKDAAAASIYGARAANGVIVITTKKAKEGKTQISASATWTIHPYNYYTGHLTDAADIIELQKKWAAANPELNNGLDRALAEADNLRNNYAWPSKGIDILLNQYTNQISQAEAEAQLEELASRGYAYYDDVEKYAKRNSFYQQYYLSVGKATGKNNLVFSVSYRNNKEEDIYTKDDQVGLNLQNSLQVTDWLKADVGMYINFRNGTTQTYDLLNSYSAGFTAMPYDRLVDEEGNPVSWTSQYTQTVRDNIENYGLYDVTITPLDELGRRLEKSRDFTSRIFGKLEVKFLPWLSYTAQYQYEYGENRMNRLEEMDSFQTRELINSFATAENGEAVYNLPEGDIYYTERQTTNNYNFRQQLNVDKTFNGVHNLTWIIGQEVRNQKLQYESVTRYGYDDDMLSSQYINESEFVNGYTGLMDSWAYISAPWAKSELVNRFVSFYSNAAYSYNNRYALSASIRWDRSNLWGTNSKYQNKPLWSVGASWNINNEAFFNASWVDMLKLRASYGIGGNIAKDAAPYLTASYYTSTLVGGQYGNISSPPNPDLRWEKTTTVNVGVDFAFFAGRMSGTLEFYNRNSDDLLANQMGVPTEGFGYSTLSFNNGAMRNRGFELTLRGDVINRGGFVWNMGYMLSYNKNKVTKINVEAPAYYLQLDYPEAYPREGKPYNAIYAYKWAGLSAEGEPQIYDAEGNITTTDYTNLDAIHYVGTTVPVYSGSFTNVFTYKNLELSVQMLYEGGHKFRSTNIPAINMGRTDVSVTSKDIMNAWEQPGDEAVTDVPRILFSGISEAYNYDRESIYRGADIHVLDASKIVFNNISLSYRVPNEWMKKVGLSAAKLQFNVENAGTIAFDKDAGYMLGTKDKPNYVLGLSLNF